MEKISKIPDYSEVTLSGGEPGLLSKNEIEKILTLLEEKKCTIDLLTNGLFFKNHLKQYERIASSIYHCIETMNDDIEFPYMDQEKTIYTIVVKPEDFENVINFINKYPHIKFMLSPNKLSTNSKKVFIEFLKFWHKYKDRLHERTYDEFIKNISKRGVI